ncbi:MAG: hypothetical protein HY248_03250 [Fimbriimonas ginsengisoli]|uniref:Uncharacterized protein n=1 Tax=Fimbriimonas ginsengisoli TaxID=1005039 RepID=A0A931PTJ8_FIMGI|nr:hypothetical protein [Fimbriimonas ginsengisoli]MBI3721546.1 hypothetical protein [Fimbriimonas ginsengisoli]
MNRSAAGRFLEVLKAAMAAEKPIAIYTNEADPTEYDVAMIEGLSREYLVYRSISPKGDDDGRRVVLLEALLRVDLGSGYLEKMRLLNQYHSSVYDGALPPAPENVDPQAVLTSAKEDGKVVSVIDRMGYGPTGFVRQVARDYVEIERLDPNGVPDGSVVILLDLIDRVCVAGREEQAVAFLNRYHVGLKKLIDS